MSSWKAIWLSELSFPVLRKIFSIGTLMNLGLAVLGWPEVGGRQLMASWLISFSALFLTGASGLGLMKAVLVPQEMEHIT